MNFNQTCLFNIIPSEKPYRKNYEYVDNKGESQTGVQHVVKGILIPDNPNADKNSVREIEISTRDFNNVHIKKGFYEAYDAWYENRNDFTTGKKYIAANCFMGSRGRNGVVTYFSPIMKDFQVIDTAENDKSYVTAALSKNDSDNI